MMIDAVFPAASELVMIYAGALAGGAIAGSRSILFGHPIDSPFWALRRRLARRDARLPARVDHRLGDRRLRRPAAARAAAARWLHLSPENLDRAEDWFERRGDAAVFLGRVTPVVRSFISIPAGVFRSPLGRYTLLTLAGSAIWCFAFAGIGWGVGTGYRRVHDDFRWVDYAVVAAVVSGRGLVAVPPLLEEILRADDPAR